MRFPRLLAPLSLVLALFLLPRAAEAAGDYLNRIATVDAFDALSAPDSQPFADRTLKYLLPASSDPALLGPVFQNTQRFRFHHEFLAAVFPDRFPGIDMAEYLRLSGLRATRKHYSGTITRYYGPTGASGYGFTVFTAGTDPAEMLEPAEVLAVYKRLQPLFSIESEFLPLTYSPLRAAEILKAETWKNTGFPIRRAGASTLPPYIAYTQAVNFGVVRVFTLAELQAAIAAGQVDWQTIVVVDDAPDDIETVVAGAVTAQPQGELSHLAVRLGRRQVPNAFVKSARSVFSAWAGKLVRLEVGAESHSIRAATLEEAEAWWRESRPSVPPLPEADGVFDGLESLTEMELDAAGSSALQRYGAKAANLARLYRHLPGPYQTLGFAIPFRHYLEFIRAGRIPSLANPAVQVSYEAQLNELLADARFRSDGAFRRTQLAALRDHWEEKGPVPAALVERLRARLLEVFADPQIKARFRSSSNAEDALEFSGAGLYDSTSVCLPDELDGDEVGPSLCDPSKASERTIARGLREVWASLWNDRAFEEREWFQIDHRRAAMAILVTRAYPSEDSNGVAFTGNPANPEDDNYLVNVQLGDASVVQPDVGVVPEKDVLAMLEGAVGRAVRIRASSLVVPGQFVLSEAQLEELGDVMAAVSGPFLDGIDLGGHARRDVLVDYEFKFQDGQLVIKQARPFLRPPLVSPGPVFEVEIPAGLELCGLWQEYRSPDDEFRLKSRLTPIPGTIRLPERAGHVPVRHFERLEFGREGRALPPLNAGLFRTQSSPGVPDGLTWSYDQDFDLEGKRFHVSFSLDFFVDPGNPGSRRIVLDEERLLGQVQIFGHAEGGDPWVDLVRYQSCSYETLPLWKVEVTFAGGDRAVFDERYLEPFAGSGPANLLAAETLLGGVTRQESSYWRLVYAADHHNWNEEFRVVFDPLIQVGATGGVAALHVQEGFDTIRRGAFLLDRDWRVLRELPLLSFTKTKVFNPRPPILLRGDANADGVRSLVDAVTVLSRVFLGDPPLLVCDKSGDANDDGVLGIQDALGILTFLFLGDRSLPGLSLSCAPDTTPDPLRCPEFPQCGF